MPFTAEASPAPAKQTASSLPAIEIGWLLAGRFESADLQAIDRAQQRVRRYLEQQLPQFHWVMPSVRRQELVQEVRVDPVVLLDFGVLERNTRHWDFTLVITPADLVGQYKPEVFAAVSRSLQGAAISTARIDPEAWQDDDAQQQRVEVMARRLERLILFSIGYLSGLSRDERPDNPMVPVENVDDFDTQETFSAGQLERLRGSLSEVADRRLEETPGFLSSRVLTFYLLSMWINRRELLAAIWQASPWQFPFRFSRLTTAAVSASLVLMITAETWDLGVSQSVFSVGALSLLTILGATCYVVARQKLLLRRKRDRMSEQAVVTNVSTVAIVLIGLFTTYLLLLTITLLLTLCLFQQEVVQTWAASYPGPVRRSLYLLFAAFVASLGILIGALGASFEQHHYFRHITFVDDEV